MLRLTFMFKTSFIFTLLLATTSILFGQQLLLDDYKVYSALIRSEILKTTKSVTIIKKFTNDTSSISWVTDAIKSKDVQQLEQLRFLTRYGKGNSVSSIDTATQKLILGFYQNQSKDSVLTNLFDLFNVKIFLIDNFPFKKSSQDEWRNFYKKYSASGGLFQFSDIYYSHDGKTAIFYHSLFRNGLNAHGALTIMTNVNGEWKIKYHVNFWQA